MSHFVNPLNARLAFVGKLHLLVSVNILKFYYKMQQNIY